RKAALDARASARCAVGRGRRYVVAHHAQALVEHAPAHAAADVAQANQADDRIAHDESPVRTCANEGEPRNSARMRCLTAWATSAASSLCASGCSHAGTFGFGSSS